MKKIDLGQSVAIVANLGVIAGIVFLAFELRQNNQLLRAQAQMQLAENRQGANEDIYQDEGIAQILVKAGRGEELDDVEQLRLTRLWANSFSKWQAEFAQMKSGLLTDEDVTPGAWNRALHFNPGMLAAWRESRDRFPQDFVEWTEREAPIRQ